MELLDAFRRTAEHTKAWAEQNFGGTTSKGDYEVKSLSALKSALSSGKKNIVLGASFEIGEQINIPQGTSINGCGYTLTRSAGFEGIMIRCTHTDNVIQNLTIDGNRQAMVSPTWDKTNEVYMGHNCIVDNVTIHNGNEAIVNHGTDSLIRNCRFYNCGGNGIHFTGSHRARVENCVVNGANLNSSMGNEGGCIKWCRECKDIVVTNCWLENGVSGFGDIEGADNAGIQLIGNTVKNCTNAVLIQFYAGVPKDIIINSNRFINSGYLDVRNSGVGVVSPLNLNISNNVFEDTSLEFTECSDVTICNNSIKGNCYIRINRAYNFIISNNVINQTGTTYNNGIVAQYSYNIQIKNNFVRSKGYILTINSGCGNCSVIGNKLIHNYANDNNASVAVDFEGLNSIFKDNFVIAYKNGIAIGKHATVEGNSFFMLVDSKNSAINDWGSKTYIVVKNNRTNGTMIANTSTDTASISDNSFPVNTDMIKTLTTTFTNITADVPNKVFIGDELECVLVADSGRSLPESITITNDGKTTLAGTDYEYDKETGKLVFYCVVGNVTITATGI